MKLLFQPLKVSHLQYKVAPIRDLKMVKINLLHRNPFFKEAPVQEGRSFEDSFPLQFRTNRQEHLKVVSITKTRMLGIGALYNGQLLRLHLHRGF